jgi:hypothetical protein
LVTLPRKLAENLNHLIKPIFDPVQAVRGLSCYYQFWKDYRRYAAMLDREDMKFKDVLPCIHDRTANTKIDYQYFYCNGWAMRRIAAQRPNSHIDIGSQTMFVNLLSAFVPVFFIDYRPLHAAIDGLSCMSADILSLPFSDKSVPSLSCLHVAEHIGLGRYGDELNPWGTRRACDELQRVLAQGGNLYFVVPVGEPRVCFNAHRIHSSKTILSYFAALDLVEFSAVDDNGRYFNDLNPSELDEAEYACGMFWFSRNR